MWTHFWQAFSCNLSFVKLLCLLANDVFMIQCAYISQVEVAYLRTNSSGYYKSTDHTKWESKRPT